MSMKRRDLQSFTLNISPRTYKALREAAFKEGTVMSEIVRSSVDEALKRMGYLAAEKKSVKKETASQAETDEG